MGRRMLNTLADHSGFEVVAGFDIDERSLQAASEQYGFAAVGSVGELLQRDDLDLVYVATPPASHIDLARKVLERGLPLFLEKPLAADFESASELVRWADSLTPSVALNFPFASLGLLQHVRQQLASGRAGVPLRVEIQLHFSEWPRTWHNAGEWLAGGDEGGFLREVFSHFVYLTQELFGPLEVLSSRTTRSAGESETRVVADLRAGQIPVSLVGGVGGAAPDYNRWNLYCDAECYGLEDWSKLFWSRRAEAWQPLTLDPASAGQPTGQLDELALLLRGEKCALPGLKAGLDVLRTVEHLLS